MKGDAKMLLQSVYHTPWAMAGNLLSTAPCHLMLYASISGPEAHAEIPEHVRKVKYLNALLNRN